MIKVAQVAEFLGLKMKQRGYPIKLRILKRACLLHDLVKVCDIADHQALSAFAQSAKDIAIWKKLRNQYGKIGHVKAGYKIMRKLAEPQIATIILKHKFDSLIAPDASSRPITWEEKLLYYADKRVKHDCLVNIEERLEDGHKRYFPKGKISAQELKRELKIKKELYKLENEIMNAADISVKELTEAAIAKSFTAKN